MCQMNVGYRITIGEDMYGGGAGLCFDIWNTDGITPPPFSRTPAPPQHPPVSPEKPGQLLQDFVIAKESAGIGGFRVEIIKMHPPPPSPDPPSPPNPLQPQASGLGWVGLAASCRNRPSGVGFLPCPTTRLNYLTVRFQGRADYRQPPDPTEAQMGGRQASGEGYIFTGDYFVWEIVFFKLAAKSASRPDRAGAGRGCARAVRNRPRS